MQIRLAQHYGLCFGVRDAINQAEHLATQAPLTILGELVHNPLVRERLTTLGAREASLSNPASVTTNQVMITAHGASDKTRESWRHAGFALADGTCPLVRHAHDKLRELVTAGYFPVVIGKSGHAEVEGLIGDFPEAAVLLEEHQAEGLPDKSRYGIIAQTTQPLDKVRRIVSAIRQAKPEADVQFRDTVCQPTKNRQTALQRLTEECDTIVVVGGHNSNNTQQLVSSARAAGCRVFHIERPDELEPEWFYDSRIVGLTAGTSTLKETVSAVFARLEALTEVPA